MAAALAAVSSRRSQTVDAALNDQTDEAPAAVPLPPTRQASVIRVVLADDHRILRTSLAMYLNDHPAIEVVGEADDGAQALAIVAETQPDLLMLDLNMPGTSGLDILPEVRKTWPDVKVLVLTGRDEDAYIMRALRAGAHGYVLKTANEDELVQAVRDVVDGHLILGRGVAERVVQGLVTRDTSEAEALTDLDRAILIGIAAGLTNEQIASRINIDSQLVDAQLMTLLDQVGAKTRTEASLIALRQGLILLEDLHNF